MRRSLETILQHAWRRRGPLARALLPLAWLYRALTALRRVAYAAGWLRSASAGVPVVVVGNVVAGGTGKTPVVIELVRHLRSRGVTVGVISRGYGRRHGSASADVAAVRHDSASDEVGDEPLLIRRATGAPVFVGRDRVAAARALRAAHPHVRVIVSDDGLQHLALRRDAEICVNGVRGTGNGWLLPAGPLRETARRVTWLLDAAAAPATTTRADRTIITPERGRFHCERRLADDALRADGTRVALAALAGEPLHAVAAIAHPDAFFAMLQARGLSLARCEALPDHDDFSSWKRPPHKRERLICTEKDAVKLWRWQPDALALPLVLRIEPGFFTEFDAWLDARGLGAEPRAASLSCADGHPTS